MKTEEIMAREKREMERKINRMTPEETLMWEEFGEALFEGDVQAFLKMANFMNGKLAYIIRQVKHKTLQEAVNFFTLYPKDCLDAWEVARLIQDDVRKKVM